MKLMNRMKLSVSKIQKRQVVMFLDVSQKYKPTLNTTVHCPYTNETEWPPKNRVLFLIRGNYKKRKITDTGA
jgi:hypothetical protein